MIERDGRAVVGCRGCIDDQQQDTRRKAFGAILRAAGFAREHEPHTPRPAPKRQQPPHNGQSKTQRKALRIIEQSCPVAGTPAERYLAGRGLANADASQLLYHSAVATPDGHFAALVAPVTPSLGGKPVACLCVLLTADGRKADVQVGKRAYGPVSKGVVHLAAEPHPVVLLAEGVESALSARLLLDDGYPMAAIGTGRLAHWQPPEWCREVVVFADGDAPGHKAAYQLKSRMDAANFPADIQWFATGDANDSLQQRKPQ